MGACDFGDIHLTKEPKKANREIAAFSVPLAVCSEGGPFFSAFISPIPSAGKFHMFRFLPLSSCTQADVVPLALPPALTASRFGSEHGWLLLCYVKRFRHLPMSFFSVGPKCWVSRPVSATLQGSPTLTSEANTPKRLSGDAPESFSCSFLHLCPGVTSLHFLHSCPLPQPFPKTIFLFTIISFFLAVSSSVAPSALQPMVGGWR